MNLKNLVWVEQFRPITMKGVILPSGLRKYFDNIIKSGELPNMLFYSTSPGVGKTSTAKAICNDLELDHLYINASKDNGIDVLRTRIENFASTMSFDGKNKVIIIDEAERMTSAFQMGFRAFIEEFNKCRFIFTCNYISQIIDPLHSRLELIDFNMTSKGVKNEMVPQIQKRICLILDKKGIDYTPELIEKFINKKYPDIRGMINTLSMYSKTNDNIDENVFNFDIIDGEFYDMVLNKDITGARKYLIEKSYNYSELYTQLYKNLVPKIPKKSQAQAILVIAEKMDWHTRSIDPEITAIACLLEIVNLL